MADEKKIEKLIEQLQSLKTRGKAIGELFKIGKPAVPYLIEALRYENPNGTLVRTGAIWALEDIGDLRFVPALIGALKHEDIFTRRSSADALSRIAGKHPEYDWKEAVPVLMYNLKDKDQTVRSRAAYALGEMLTKFIKRIVEAEGSSAALKDIKNVTLEVRKADDKHLRRKLIGKLAEATQQIHDKMNPDKKKFPVKHQPVRRTQVRRVIRSG